MMEIDEMLFAKNLKRLMKKTKMSNRVLSAYTKICTSTIECYRLGKGFVGRVKKWQRRMIG